VRRRRLTPDDRPPTVLVDVVDEQCVHVVGQAAGEQGAESELLGIARVALFTPRQTQILSPVHFGVLDHGGEHSRQLA